MHIGKCVPMIALCLLLCGCKEQAEETDIRAAYREMSGCELTMKVVCGEAQREWAATLQCHYAPEGESTVEVTEPLELAGVRAVLREADWSLEKVGQRVNSEKKVRKVRRDVVAQADTWASEGREAQTDE